MLYPINIKKEYLPLWVIEIRENDGEWFRWLALLFKTKIEAAAYIGEKVSVAIDVRNTRIAEYTEKEWHEDLIKLILNDPACMATLLEGTDADKIVQAIRTTWNIDLNQERD